MLIRVRGVPSCLDPKRLNPIIVLVLALEVWLCCGEKEKGAGAWPMSYLGQTGPE